MTDVLLPVDLRGRGIEADSWLKMADRGELVRLRRGAFIWPADHGGDEITRHRQLMGANLAYLSNESVISHASAAVLHGLPVWTNDLTAVHITRSRSFGGRIGPYVHSYPAPLSPEEVTVVDGIAVTTAARTAVDLARHSSFERGVAVLDAALRLGVGLDEVQAVTERSRRRPGIVRARRAVLLANGRSESVGESFSRVVFIGLGMPPSHLQYEVFDLYGSLIGRSDFCWEDHHTLGEFDGKIKYQSLVPVGSSASEVVITEKLREDALRETGRELVRWTWEDLHNPRRLGERVRRVFARADARH